MGNVVKGFQGYDIANPDFVPSAEKRPPQFADDDRIFSLSSMTSPVWLKRRDKDKGGDKSHAPTLRKVNKFLADLDAPSTSSSVQNDDEDEKKDTKALRRQSTTAASRKRKR